MNDIYLSAVIITKNEEKNIGNLIKSLGKIADEVIAIDDNSIDQTRQIATKLGAKVIRNSLTDFASQRNFGLKKAKGEWVLYIDADEAVSPKLAQEIRRAIPTNSFNGYYIPRKDYFYGKTLNYGEAGRTKLLRLGRKDYGKWARGVHETWEVKGKTGILKNYLYHYSHKNITEFVDSINNFSTLHAEANKKEGKKSSIFKIVFWPFGKFFLNYVLKLGFLDGTKGFVFAVIISMHSYLAWSKQWIEEHN